MLGNLFSQSIKSGVQRQFSVAHSIGRVLVISLVLLLGYSGSAFAADPTKGGKLYSKHCTNCHGSSGSAQLPGTPDFSRGEKLLQPDTALMEKIKEGIGMMPAYQGRLTDEEILDVISFLRTLH